MRHIGKDLKEPFMFSSLMLLNIFILVGLARILHLVYLANDPHSSYVLSVATACISSFVIWLIFQAGLIWSIDYIRAYRRKLSNEFDLYIAHDH